MPVFKKQETKEIKKKTIEAQAEELADALGKFMSFRELDMGDDWSKQLKQLTFIEDNLRSTNLETLLKVQDAAEKLHYQFEGQLSGEKSAAISKAKFAYWGEHIDQAQKLLDLVRKIREKQLDLQPDYDESRQGITPTP